MLFEQAFSRVMSGKQIGAHSKYYQIKTHDAILFGEYKCFKVFSAGSVKIFARITMTLFFSCINICRVPRMHEEKTYEIHLVN